MTAALFLKNKKDPVYYIRAWSRSDGRQIFLFLNGVYGYKDESPVRSKDELELIDDPIQRRAAEVWWESVGREKSAKHYEEVEAKLERHQKKTLTEIAEGDVSQLDAAVYTRRDPGNAKGKKVVSKPTAWPEWFGRRPDWWGHAVSIVIGGFCYELVRPEEEEEIQRSDDGDRKSGKESKEKNGTF